MLAFDTGDADGDGALTFSDCKPPTTPPTTAAAMTKANISPNISQKCFLLSPHVLFGCGTGVLSMSGEATLSIFLYCGKGGSGLPATVEPL